MTLDYSPPTPEKRPIKVLIVDDNIDHRQRLRSQIEQFPEIGRPIHEAESGQAGIDFLKANPVDLVFLDVQMAPMDGFEMLRRLGREPGFGFDFDLIFCSSFDEYAKRAFLFNAVHFVNKSDPPKVLREAFERCINHPRHTIEAYESLIESYVEIIGKRIPKLLLRPFKSQSLVSVKLLEIEFITADNQRSMIFLKGKLSPLVVGKLLKEFMFLEEYGFFRCHDSVIIQVEEVEELLADSSKVRMPNGFKVPVAKNKIRQLRELLERRKKRP